MASEKRAQAEGGAAPAEARRSAAGRRRRPPVQRVRALAPVIVILAVGAGFFTTWGLGTLSGLGWGEITALCPLGALTTMLASKTLVPRALVSLAIAFVLMLAFGRAFCGWVCPVPVVARVRSLFARNPRQKAAGKAKAGGKARAAGDALAGMSTSGRAGEAGPSTPGLSAAEKRAIRRELAGGCAAAHVRELRGALDSRHVVLGGALACALAFGFPVFCLICPVGLTFATVLLVVRAFGAGDVTVGLLVVPLVLVLEVVVFRRWCHAFCPLGALMSLVGRASRTLRPKIDDALCLETQVGKTCGACSRACPEGIDIRHLERGAALSECVRCHRCADACPRRAVTFPLLAKKEG